MVREVELDLKDVPKRGRPAKYPWDKWFDGKTRVLEQGVDYEADSPKSFRSTVYSAAKRMGIGIETRIIDGELHIQAILPDDEEAKPKSNGRVARKKSRRETRG